MRSDFPLRTENANPTPAGIGKARKFSTEDNEETLLFLLAKIITDEKAFVVGSDGQYRTDSMHWFNLADPPGEETLANHEFAAIFLGNRHRKPPSY